MSGWHAVLLMTGGSAAAVYAYLYAAVKLTEWLAGSPQYAVAGFLGAVGIALVFTSSLDRRLRRRRDHA